MTTGTVATNKLEASRLTTDRLSTKLPGYVMLADGERVVQSASFRFSPAHFFLASRLVLTSKQLGGERPKVLLGLVPIGSERFTFPLSNLASVGAGAGLRGRQLLVGLVLLAPAAAGLIDNGRAWPIPLVGLLVVVGAALFLGAFQAVLRVRDNGGGVTPIGVSIFAKDKARAFADQVNAAIEGR
jgi:hypothetical protein